MPLVGGMAVQSSPSTSSSSAYPPSPFAGAFAAPQQQYYPQGQQGQYAQQHQQVPVPQRDVTTVTVEYGAQQYEAHTTHHSSRRHSHSHAHARPHRTSNASRPRSCFSPIPSVFSFS